MLIFYSISIFPQSSNECLAIGWMGVIDNGEGSNPPHGPLGNLHVEIWDLSGNRIHHSILPGPTNAEWDDGDKATLNIGFYWQGHTVFTVRIYESDPGGPLLGRKHDNLFIQTVYYKDIKSNPRVFSSYMNAEPDAINRAHQRNGSYRTKWWFHKHCHRGVPVKKMYIELYNSTCN